MENETAEFQPFFDRLLQICDENASTGFNRIQMLKSNHIVAG